MKSRCVDLAIEFRACLDENVLLLFSLFSPLAQLNGETYLIPGPVLKSTSAFFPETPFKKVINVQLSK